jgi:dTDP-4-amino-4,6-dideoxygalactose transaminase
MKKHGVDTGIHWQAGHSFTFLKDCRRGSLNVTERIVEQILSLPLHSKMSDSDIDRVIESITSFNSNP